MELEKFEFSEEIINYFKESHFIPINFYNKAGQVLIHQKPDASSHEIDSLLRFQSQGIYYLKEDKHKLYKKKSRREVLEGLTDTKLLSEENSKALVHVSTDIFQELRTSSLTSLSTRKMKNNVNDVFQKFEKQPDLMTGLINILDLMRNEELGYEIEIAVKRTVVAMAIKTRGVIYQGAKDREKMQAPMNQLMCAALLLDVSYLKMSVPSDSEISSDQMHYIQNHPFVSYLMVAHDDTLDRQVKRNILVHHRPMPESGENNNYPKLKWLIPKLMGLYKEYKDKPEKRALTHSIAATLQDLKNELPYDEDAGILSLASEFASLTTDVSWRSAYSPEKAVKMIVNNSYYTYPARLIREFLDNVAISLCDNRVILAKGNFVIITADTLHGNSHLEVCLITHVDRRQSRPDVKRVGFITPKIIKEPKLRVVGFEPENITMDKRMANYSLKSDNSRRIIYIVDPEMDEELYEYLVDITKDRI